MQPNYGSYDTLLIDVMGSDSTFQNIDYQHIKYGIRITGGAFVDNFHGYITSRSIYPGSYCMRVGKNGFVIASQYYPDTQQYGTIVNNDGKPVIINGGMSYFSPDSEIATSGAVSEYPPYLFYGANSDQLTGVNVCGMHFNAPEGVNGEPYTYTLCNVDTQLKIINAVYNNIIGQQKDDIGQIKDDIDSKPQFGDPYEGVDLTIKHATEIADYASPWAWIKARIVAGNFSQLHVGDYIPFTTTNGRTFHAQIAGINTYKGYGDTEIGNHIDFITRELWPDVFQMNFVNLNNGTSSDKKVPWLASNGYLFVNSLAGQVANSTTKPLEMADVDYTSGGIYFYLPDDLKAVIVEKRIYAQTRFSDSGVLTNDNGAEWINIGKLWLLDEYEATGARQMTSTGWFSGGYVHYPIFASNMNRTKRVNSSRRNWWLSSAFGGGSSKFTFIATFGNIFNGSASYDLYSPICFRIM